MISNWKEIQYDGRQVTLTYAKARHAKHLSRARSSSKKYYLTRNGQLGVTTFGEKTENHYQSVWDQYWNK